MKGEAQSLPDHEAEPKAPAETEAVIPVFWRSVVLRAVPVAEVPTVKVTA